MVSEMDQGLHAPTKIPKDIKMIKEEAAPQASMSGVAGMSGMSGSGGGVMGGVLGGLGKEARPKVRKRFRCGAWWICRERVVYEGFW